jgi:flavin reductase (DIM6/NTAB) family NADH-FMN oxidoreductase RutF
MTQDTNDLTAGLKQAMQNAPATVTVITVGASMSEANGLTATSVCSVSMDPPSILVCVNRDSNSHQLITESGRFCANYLSLDQKAIAESFASPGTGPEKFERASAGAREEDGWVELKGCLANLCCEVSQSIEAGTHSIFIGTVKRVSVSEGGVPLLYGMRGFGSFATD